MKAPHYDIAIIGAGSAGIAATIGAARAGATVILVEKSDRLGGNATNAMVGTICGLARCGRNATPTPHIEIPGFAGDFARHVAAESSTTLTSNNQGLVYLPYRVDAFESVAEASVRDHSAISIATRTSLKSIERTTGDNTFRLSLIGQRAHSVTAQALIDTTGASEALQLLGLETRAPQPPQAAALVFELSNCPTMSEASLGMLIRKNLREGSLAGHLSERHTFVSLVPGSLRNGTVLCKLGTPPPSPDSPREDLRGAALRDIGSIAGFLTASPDFRGVQLTHTADHLGERSGNRGVGLEALSEGAILQGLPHSKGIALGLWPAEIWNTPIRPEMTFLGGSGWYEIPLGALCARNAPGVYFAGRALSATDLAIASARVIGTCLATGFAAGQLAARTLRGESEDSIVRTLRAEQVEPFHLLTAA